MSSGFIDFILITFVNAFTRSTARYKHDKDPKKIGKFYVTAEGFNGAFRRESSRSRTVRRSTGEIWSIRRPDAANFREIRALWRRERKNINYVTVMCWKISSIRRRLVMNKCTYHPVWSCVCDLWLFTDCWLFSFSSSLLVLPVREITIMFSSCRSR